MGLRVKFNLAFILIFVVGLSITGGVSYLTELQRAREEVVHNAELLLSMALATRNYTVSNVRPLISEQNEVTFLPETVPSFAAQETFLTFNDDFPEFTYREAALNPTNSRDLATSWEVDVIQRFSTQDETTQLVGIRQTDTGPNLYLARPIRITNADCLVCHSTPDAAPASMIALYGSDGGFGWEMDEVVGSQIVSVPMAAPYAKARESTLTLIGSLFSVFTLILIAVNILLDRTFIQPLRTLAHVTERYSKGEVDIREFESNRQDEIGKLERATNRLRRSLEKAMRIAENRES